MLFRYPDEETTILLQQKLFRGVVFKDFFGFEIPTDGDTAKHKYAEFWKRHSNSELTLRSDAFLRGETTTDYAEHSREKTKLDGLVEEAHKSLDRRQAKQHFLQSKAWIVGVVATGATALFFVLKFSNLYNSISDHFFSSFLNNEIPDATGTVLATSDATTFSQTISFGVEDTLTFFNDGAFFGSEDTGEVLVISAPNPAARRLEEISIEAKGFDLFTLLSKQVRADTDLDWPYQYLANGKGTLYGRPDKTLKADRRFQTAFDLKTLQLSCTSEVSMANGHYRLTQPNCKQPNLKWKNADGEIGRVGFSDVLTDVFPLDYPDINEISFELDEYPGGFLSTMKLTASDVADTSIVSNFHLHGETQWSVVFGGGRTRAFVIGRPKTGLAVLVHSEGTATTHDKVVLLDLISGRVHSSLRIKEPLRFFDLEYFDHKKSGTLSLSTDNHIYHLQLENQASRAFPVLD